MDLQIGMSMDDISQWVKEAGHDAVALNLARLYYAMQAAQEDQPKFAARRFTTVLKDMAKARSVRLAIGLFCSDQYLFTAQRAQWQRAEQIWIDQCVPQIQALIIRERLKAS